MDEPSLLTSWTLDPLQLAPIALIAVAYAMRARTLARRGQPVPGWRVALFALGIALLVVAVASPIAAVGEEELFSFHMTQHLLLGDLAPLCLLAGLTGPVAPPDPRAARSHAAARPREPVRRVPDLGGESRALASPRALRGRRRVERSPRLEHVAFFSAGIVLWLPVLETLPAPEWFGTGAKLAYIVGVRLVATVIGNVFVWGGSAFYDVYGTGDDYLGLSPDADQSLAGSLMMLEGSLVTDRRARVALPADGAGGRGAPGADREGRRRANRAACRSLPAVGGAHLIGSVWGLLLVGLVLASASMAAPLGRAGADPRREPRRRRVGGAHRLRGDPYALLADGDVAHRVLAAVLASVWGFRLGAYLFFDRVLGKEEDGRYQELRRKWGMNANRNFFFFFQAQALFVVFFSLPFAFIALDPARASASSRGSASRSGRSGTSGRSSPTASSPGGARTRRTGGRPRAAACGAGRATRTTSSSG